MEIAVFYGDEISDPVFVIRITVCPWFDEFGVIGSGGLEGLGSEDVAKIGNAQGVGKG